MDPHFLMLQAYILPFFIRKIQLLKQNQLDDQAVHINSHMITIDVMKSTVLGTVSSSNAKMWFVGQAII
jgi:hypothetical protein